MSSKLSRFPIWKTRPAGFAVSGYWPILTGSLAVLVGFPVFAYLAGMIGNFVFGQSSWLSTSTNSITVVLVFSPVFSWAVMIIAVPLSAFAARVGMAGWGVAALAGAVAGFVTECISSGRVAFNGETRTFIIVGIVLALVYWGAIRVMHPTAIGIDFQKPKE